MSDFRIFPSVDPTELEQLDSKVFTVDHDHVENPFFFLGTGFGSKMETFPDLTDGRT